MRKSVVLLVLCVLVSFTMPAIAEQKKPAAPAVSDEQKPKLPAAATAKPPVETPVLSVEEKQAIDIVLLRMQNAQQAAQIAQTQYKDAEADGNRLLQALQKEGFTLDLNTKTYVPVK